MNRWLRGGLALGLGFSLTVLAIEIEQRTSEPDEAAGTLLGSLDMVKYCAAEHGDRARAIHPGSGAYGWQCWLFVGGLLTTYPVDASKGCGRQFGEPAYAEAGDPGDPNSWQCRRGSAPGG